VAHAMGEAGMGITVMVWEALLLLLWLVLLW
jgi:hypothetical protein